MKKKTLALILSAALSMSMLCALAGCGNKGTENAQPATENIANEENADVVEVSEDTAASEEISRGDITIVFTSDVHSYLFNQKKDENEEMVTLLTYGKVAALRDDLAAAGENVFLVDIGDHVQGNAYGGMDDGQSVVELMGAVGYDASAVGNHEFDYGMFRAMQIFDTADYPYVCCNFYDTKTNELVLPSYVVVERNGIKVAFVGITTPEAISKTTPKYFQDEAGNLIYDFYAGNDGQELYDAVQSAVDAAKEEADYVIAIGHMGSLESEAPYRSVDVIANTRGIDAFLDGHSHELVVGNEVANIDGEKITISQTGSYLNAIGLLRLSDNDAKVEMVTEYENSNPEIDAMTESIVTRVNDELGVNIAVLDNPLYIMDAKDSEKRLVRMQDTNVSDLVTDAIYWFFNDLSDLDCDMTISNGGGLRSDIEAGDFSYLSAKKIQPFGNQICLVEVTGQVMLDALEWGARKVGVDENGGFLHVAGVKFTIDTSIECTAEGNDDGAFISAPTGEYRVKDVQVYNRETGEYEDLVLDKTYTVGGVDYILRNSGDGFTMFDSSVCIIDYVDEDYLVFSKYVALFEKGDDGMPHINNANAPVAALTGYMYDYENPVGSGRILVK